MAGTTININDSGFTGYLVTPTSAKAPGILLIQEVFGVNSHIREVADMYGELGYVVLAPDVFWRQEPRMELGYTADDLKKGIEMAGKLNPKETLRDLQAAIDVLKKRPECTGKIGAVGYCMGGSLTYAVAANNMVDAASSFYGGNITSNLDVAKNIKCPLEFHFGAKDPYIPMSDVDKIRKAMPANAPVEFFIYDADHGFNCDQRASYDRHSAMVAFGRTAELLAKHLR